MKEDKIFKAPDPPHKEQEKRQDQERHRRLVRGIIAFFVITLIGLAFLRQSIFRDCEAVLLIPLVALLAWLIWENYRNKRNRGDGEQD